MCGGGCSCLLAFLHLLQGSDRGQSSEQRKAVEYSKAVASYMMCFQTKAWPFCLSSSGTLRKNYASQRKTELFFSTPVLTFVFPPVQSVLCRQAFYLKQQISYFSGLMEVLHLVSIVFNQPCSNCLAHFHTAHSFTSCFSTW